MEQYWYVIMFILGTMLGSFLNVVLYRMHTGRSVNGRSHCMSCGETLTWYELFPVVSFLALRSRCGHCSARIPLRYLTVEILTGLSFVLMYSMFAESLVLLVINSILALVLVVIVIYDIRHTIIPNECVVLLSLLALIILGLRYAVGGGILGSIVDLASGFGGAFFFYMLWRVSNGRWIGLGDAKLALPLGVIVGSSGVFSMIVLSFWVGAGISLSLLLLQHVLQKGKTLLRFQSPQLTIKSEVPFAPFLILGFLLAYLFHADIFVITSALIPL
jgi:leader peptidase (prepilin peptidase)/N-methyltransferase